MPNPFDGVSSVPAESAQYDRGAYLDTVDPSELVDDPRFLADLREYYGMRGISGVDDADLVRKWYDDRTFSELNITRGITSDVYDTYQANAKERVLKKRLVSAYQKTPFFWQEGGMGERDGWQVAKSISWALATDPLTFIAPARAAGAAGIAMRTAAREGRNVVRAGMARGAVVGGATEAAIAAPITGAADAAIQGRDIQLGLQDEFDPTRTVLATGAGAALGGTLGAAGGAVVGGFARGKARSLQTDSLNRTYEVRPGEFAAPTDRIGYDLAANERLIDEEKIITGELNLAQKELDEAGTPGAALQQEPAGTNQAPSGVRPSDIDTTVTQDNMSQTANAVQEAHRDGLDADTIADLQAEANEARMINNLAERIKKEEAEIDALYQTNEEGSAGKADKRNDKLQSAIGAYRRLVEGDGSTRDEDVRAANEALGGARADEDADITLPAAPEDGVPVSRGRGDTPDILDEDLVPLKSIDLPRGVPDDDGNLSSETINAADLYANITDRFDSLHALRKCLAG